MELNSRTLMKALREIADPEIAQNLQRYFKTGPGEYGEGDRFLGVKMPSLRKLAKAYKGLPLSEVGQVIASPWHEARMTGLLILALQFKSAQPELRKKIYQLYLRNTQYINNWDLVDVTCVHIVGAYLLDQDRAQLYTFARSRDLWKRRIAIISTAAFIREDEFEDTLAIGEMLLDDHNDLIHKAVGWMLREVGNRDRQVAEGFLKRHYKIMPRTMLRYAIEKYPESLRLRYLHGKV